MGFFSNLASEIDPSDFEDMKSDLGYTQHLMEGLAAQIDHVRIRQEIASSQKAAVLISLGFDAPSIQHAGPSPADASAWAPIVFDLVRQWYDAEVCAHADSGAPFGRGYFTPDAGSGPSVSLILVLQNDRWLHSPEAKASWVRRLGSKSYSSGRIFRQTLAPTIADVGAHFLNRFSTKWTPDCRMCLPHEEDPLLLWELPELYPSPATAEGSSPKQGDGYTAWERFLTDIDD